MPPSNTPPRFLSSTPRQKEIIHFRQAVFFEIYFPPAESGEGKQTMGLKNDQN